MTKHYILQALNADRKSVYIDNVPNGKNCACTCAECGGKLIAKNKGRIKIHHFAHESGNDSIRCSQTALHLLAKEIIAEEKKIPALVGGRINFVLVENIEQEKNMGDIKPDLYAKYSEKPIAVEIFVSHAVDEIKFNKIQEHKLTTFEIDLSKTIFVNKEEVRKAIYNLKNIQIIYDYEIIERMLMQKRQFIMQNGRKHYAYHCPKPRIIINDKHQKIYIINPTNCKNCPMEYNDYCIGHLNIQNIDLYLFRLNANNGRLMSFSECLRQIR